MIPGLADLRNRQNVSVNRAELLVPVKPFSNTLFPYPTATYLYEARADNQVLQRARLGHIEVNRLVQAEGFNQQSQSVGPQGQGSQATGLLYALDATNSYYSILVTSYVQAYLLNQLGGDLPDALLLSPTLVLPQAYQPDNNLTLSLNRAALDASNIKLRVYYSNQQ